MKRFMILPFILFLLGAGCLSTTPYEPLPPEDPTPGVNEENCMASGGAVADDACECPEGTLPDPAGFCLDAEGKIPVK